MPDTRALALAVVVVAVLPACLDASPPPEVGRAEQEVNVNVTWENLVDAQTIGAGNGLQKTGQTTGWNAGASSVQTIGGHGFVRFASSDPGDQTLAKAIGLSSGNNGSHIADIDYAMYLRSDGKIYELQNGTGMGQIGTYVDGDIFQIEATPTSVIYKQKVGNSYTILRTTNVPAGLAFPLLVDTSLNAPDATFGNVVINEDPKIHVGVQQNLLAAAPRCGVGDTIVLSGSHFSEAGDCQTNFQTFAELDPDELKDDLLEYIDGHEDLDVADLDRADRIVVIDVERPGATKIWRETDCPNGDMDGNINHNPVQRGYIIEGLRRRIIGTRLAFPNAKLALFPSLAPHAQGARTEGGTFDVQVDGLVEAQADGLFDDLEWATCPSGVCNGLDYFIPVLYTRFGCDVDPADCDTAWGADTVAAYTNQAITVTDTEINPGLPLLPFFSFSVANATPFNNRSILSFGVGWETALDETLRVSMSILKDAQVDGFDVDHVVLWKGGFKDDIVRDGVQPEPNQMCWNAAEDAVDTCVSFNPVSTNYVTVGDYTCWM